MATEEMISNQVEKIRCKMKILRWFFSLFQHYCQKCKIDRIQKLLMVIFYKTFRQVNF